MNHNTNKNPMELAGVKEDKYGSLKETGMINEKAKDKKVEEDLKDNEYNKIRIIDIIYIFFIFFMMCFVLPNILFL